MDYYSLPHDVVSIDTYNYYTSLELDVPAGTESLRRAVKATLYDKAGNSKTIETEVLYDSTRPQFSQIIVQTDLNDPSKKLFCPTEEELTCTLTSKYFKTNDREVRIMGLTDRELRSLFLYTGGGKMLPVDFVRQPPFSFSIDLDLYNSGL